jgi:hypothetical protein
VPLIFHVMNLITWPTSTERVRGRRIDGLAYDAENGMLRVELAGGTVLLVSACREGVHVVVDEAPGKPESARI